MKVKTGALESGFSGVFTLLQALYFDINNRFTMCWIIDSVRDGISINSKIHY